MHSQQATFQDFDFLQKQQQKEGWVYEYTQWGGTILRTTRWNVGVLKTVYENQVLYAYLLKQFNIQASFK